MTFMIISAESVHKYRTTALRLFGIANDDAGTNVSCLVHSFNHYFYVSLEGSPRVKDIEAWRNAINESAQKISDANQRFKRFKASNPVDHVTHIRFEDNLESIRFFKPNMQDSERWFYRVYLGFPGAMEAVRGAIKDKYPKAHFFEDRVVTHPIRFMVDMGASSMTWVTLPAAFYRNVSEGRKVTKCPIEVQVFNHRKIIVHSPSEGDEWAHLGNCRVMSFDIECCSRDGSLPTPSRDPVVQIGVTCWSVQSGVYRQVGISVGGVQTESFPTKGAEVIVCEDESELFMAFHSLWEEVSPQFATGYNILGFDMHYLLERAEVLQLEEFAFLGAYTDKPVTCTERKQGGLNTYLYNNLDCVLVDMLNIVKSEHKYRTYTLNAVSKHLLGDQKEDLHHSLIPRLATESDETRTRLLVYCLKDTMLPIRLMEKLEVLVRYAEIARLCYINIHDAIHRKQQIRVAIKLLATAKSMGYVVPFSHGKVSQASYEGGLVLEPERGYYGVKQPISVMDFNSLYPNTMLWRNLSYDTLLLDHERHMLSPDDYFTSDEGKSFVHSHIREGIVPKVLRVFLDARGQAKEEMKSWKQKAREETADPVKRLFYLQKAAVQNGRQLALKVVANSLYGFTGFPNGYLPELAISAATTSEGRKALMNVSHFICTTYTRKAGYPGDAKVVYGDTDSVMVLTGHDTIKGALDWMSEAEVTINQALFPGTPMKLAREKALCPSIFVNKKRYCGGFWTRPDEMDKVYSTGLENVRRDSCILVSNVYDGIMAKLFQCVDGAPYSDVQGATDLVVDVIQRLYLNQVGMDELLISKGLTRPVDQYAATQAHVELVKRMQKRDPMSAPRVGDRVCYVMVPDRVAEDPIYALQHSIGIDTRYYIEKQLLGPVTRILSPVVGANGINHIFHGEHTTRRVSADIGLCKKNAPKGSILHFATVKVRCRVCREGFVAKGKKLPVCNACTRAGKDVAYRAEQEEALQKAQIAYDDVYKFCQGCQGSDAEVVCMAKDCPVLYKRSERLIKLTQLKQDLSW